MRGFGVSLAFSLSYHDRSCRKIIICFGKLGIYVSLYIPCIAHIIGMAFDPDLNFASLFISSKT
jgi:hypothetical protein